MGCRSRWGRECGGRGWRGQRRERGTFNNGSNQNNVTSNWLSVEMLFYTKALVSSLCFQRAESYSLSKHTHREADWELRAEKSAAVSIASLLLFTLPSPDPLLPPSTAGQPTVFKMESLGRTGYHADRGRGKVSLFLFSELFTFTMFEETLM